MKTVGVIFLLCIIAAGGAVMIYQTAAPERNQSRGLAAHKEDAAKRAKAITDAHPVTRPADVGGDVEWFNQLVREGKAVGPVVSGPSTRDTIER